MILLGLTNVVIVFVASLIIIVSLYVATNYNSYSGTLEITGIAILCLVLFGVMPAMLFEYVIDFALFYCIACGVLIITSLFIVDNCHRFTLGFSLPKINFKAIIPEFKRLFLDPPVGVTRKIQGINFYFLVD